MDTVNVKKYPGHVTAEVEVKKSIGGLSVFGLVALQGGARLRRGHIPRGVPKPVAALLRSRRG